MDGRRRTRVGAAAGATKPGFLGGDMGSGADDGRKRARWIVAGLLLVGLAVAAAVSGLTPHLRVCAQSADGAASCRAMALSDLHVITIFVLAALLLLPDLSKLKIGGLIEIERVVADTSRKVEVADAKLERVLQQMAAISFSNAQADASASNSQNMSFTLIVPSPAHLDEDSMARKAKEGLGVD